MVPTCGPCVVGARSEYNGPTANCPIGRASGPGANRVHGHRAPARLAVPRRTRSRPPLARAEPTVLIRPPRLDRTGTQGLLRACEPLAVFGDSGLYGSGDLYDQGC